MEQKKKIVVPPSFLKESELPKNIKNFFEGIREIGEATKKEEEQFLIDLNKKIELILESSDSNSYKLRDLIELKASIEKEKIETKYGSRKKTIEEKAIPLLHVQITKLNELIRINPDLKTSTKNVVVAKANESEINSPSTQINPPESELIVPYEKIIAKTSKKEIEKYFYKLAKNTNPINGKPFLNQTLIDELLAQTINVFENTKRKHQLFDLNVNGKQVGLIYTFVYKFYQLNEKQIGGTKQTYAEFLKKNFSNFSALDTKKIYGRLRIYDDAMEKYPWL